MDYKFKIKKVSGIIFFLVSSDTHVIERFGMHDWTGAISQKIIDGIQKCKDSGERYEWANESVYLLATTEGVFLIDLLSRLADRSKYGEGADFHLTHDECITFMTDFKQFIEDNSK